MLPILYQNKDLILYSYPILMGIGWGVAYQIYFSLMTLPKWKAQALFWGLFIAAWIGAKIFFVITAESSDLLTSSNFWMGGGFVFYGGLIGGFLFVTLFKYLSRIKITDLWPVLPALTFGHAIGRVGCFLAGCCYGRPTDFFWGVYLHNHYRHPTQILESLGLFIIGFVLLKSKAHKLTLLSFYLVSYGILRLFIESLRGDAIRGSWGFLTPSQWVSLVLVSAGILVFLHVKSRGYLSKLN